mmetsp:Transcript_148083/g.384817  ORF Transcript_148083/g.384817 Transcript_148083/m.384817 type:complete len:241 (-) Transcript_148083:135-857(-)
MPRKELVLGVMRSIARRAEMSIVIGAIHRGGPLATCVANDRPRVHLPLFEKHVDEAIRHDLLTAFDAVNLPPLSSPGPDVGLCVPDRIRVRLAQSRSERGGPAFHQARREKIRVPLWLALLQRRGPPQGHLTSQEAAHSAGLGLWWKFERTDGQVNTLEVYPWLDSPCRGLGEDPPGHERGRIQETIDKRPLQLRGINPKPLDLPVLCQLEDAPHTHVSRAETHLAPVLPALHLILVVIP